jgi:hypothetical protein
MDDERRVILIELIQKLQLEIGFVMETWVDILAAPVPSDRDGLAAHIASLRHAAHEIMALTEAAEALWVRCDLGRAK